ncbi:MAG TPA: FAD-linked oxidase C-terminal domain-containing protein, partial [Steroidobacteraceae bacterium]|nr:FAD-linked oxidase C-terminal domain-containing protein [Steroidobacteraceae bacterium]
PDFDTGFRAVEACFAVGLVPAMVDFGQTYQGPRDGAEPFTPAGAPGRLQLAFEGFAEGVEAASGRALAICRRNDGTLLPSEQAQEFWDQRHVVAERFRERRPEPEGEDHDSWLPAGVYFDFVHVALPASRVLTCRDQAATMMRRHGVSVVEWGLWNQPELFSVVVQRHVENAGDAAAFARAVDDLLRLAQDLGGSMEYCHGAGLRLAPLMAREHGHGLDLLRAIKRQADPKAILNPGKLDLGA